LHYFSIIAREGGVGRAARALGVAQSNVSEQLRALETQVGSPLFDRLGNRLELTATGRLVLRYASEMTNLADELEAVLRDGAPGRRERFAIGISETVPKTLAERVLTDALQGETDLSLVVRTDRMEVLSEALIERSLDMLLTDVAADPDDDRLTSHEVGASGSLTFFYRGDAAVAYKERFPKSLDGAPMLLPGSSSALRRVIDRWFEEVGVRGNIRAELEDYALLKLLGQRGHGVYAVPTLVAAEQTAAGATALGEAKTAQQTFWLVVPSRRALTEQASRMLERCRRVFSPAS